VTSSDFDVLEASFAPDRTIVFAAFKQGTPPALFRLSPKSAGKIERLTTLESRYPAISPDGRWLAYSQLVHGSWNLRLRNMNTGATESLTDAACNSVESAWENDSRTLLYASDCGRGYGQTALYRRRVVP
jgi:Tol biopolymer transport system component